MSVEREGGGLKPIAPSRVAEELERLSAMRRNGQLDADEYEHRFARMVGELRDRKIDGTRADLLAAITPLRDRGTVAGEEVDRLLKQLGVA